MGRGQILRIGRAAGPIRLATVGAIVAVTILTMVMGVVSARPLGAPGTGATFGPPRAAPGAAPTEISTPIAGASARGVAGAIQNATIGSPSASPTPSATAYPLSLSTAISPDKICDDGSTDCAAGAGEARLTIQATAASAPKPFWPNVQITFVIETTAYDGVYYHYFGYPGTDPCADADSRQGLPCEESNGVPFFLANAGAIASEIQQNNPHSHVTFALVDFFGTNCGDWNDCGDSYEYHVDIPEFVDAGEFGSAVQQTFQDGQFGGGFIGIVGLDDNFLHVPSITALYGAIIGSGLDWSANTHHVIVLMGSAAPRALGYDEDYYVSPFDPCCAGSQADGWTCEPSYTFTLGASPNCEGWVHSQDGNPNDSIAALTKTSPTCTDSVGRDCTIDVLDYWTTPTDPDSEGWPKVPAYHSGTQNGPGAPRVVENTEHVLEAGCDMAAATGGTWDGPSYWTCPSGVSGSLEYVAHGSYSKPNTVNPTLMAALRTIGFGPVYQTLVANGTNAPLFQYVPFGNIHLAANPEVATSCSTPTGYLPTCQQRPTNITENGVQAIGWNWSTDPKDNAIYVGDSWTASFNVIAIGPPYFAQVPALACTTPTCRAYGSGAVNALYTWADYRLPGNTSNDNLTIVQSFPLATLEVEITAPVTLPPPSVPPPPPTPPGIPNPVPTTLPVGNPIGTVNSVGVSNVSLQATAAGFLGAGFVRVSLKNRPIAMKIAAKSGTVTSKFDAGLKAGSGPGVGKFE